MSLWAVAHFAFDLASLLLWILFAMSQLMWRKRRFG